ncbi:hypothetical protein LQM11_005006 [Vibrio parahaemolyticus]|nr:hypothetical protein [Vibrio parahaemolyticus]
MTTKTELISVRVDETQSGELDLLFKFTSQSRPDFLREILSLGAKEFRKQMRGPNVLKYEEQSFDVRFRSLEERIKALEKTLPNKIKAWLRVE